MKKETEQGGASQQREQKQKPTTTRRGGEEASPTSSMHAGSGFTVLLQTAMVRAFKPGSQPTSSTRITALLDSGSQRSYISQAVASQLNLKPKRSESLIIKTFGESSGSQQTCQVVDLAIQAKGGEIIIVEVLVVPLICDALSQQATRTAKKKHPHLRDLRLADCTSTKDSLSVDLLIGSDHYWSIVTGNIRRGKTGPTAIHTRVGWVLSGQSEIPENTTTASLLLSTTHLLRIQATPAEQSLDDKLQRFWDLETLGIQPEEKSIQDTFNQSLTFSEGRYEVSLPWKTTHRPLPSNLQLCHKRLQALIKKLQSTPEVLTDYDKVMKEQLSGGIIEEVPESEVGRGEKVHYLPHHAVLRADKATTKLRVVYDGSAKTGNNPSLNECLYTGPSFDQSILDILLRFRTYPVAMIADLEKAFLMVSIQEQDRDALRLLWTPDINQNPPEVKSYRFTRVVFGVRCSPFLLNATLRHHIQQYSEQDPTFVKTLMSSLYVDDVSFGAQDEVSAYQLYCKSKLRLAEAGFNLRKFASNSISLQQKIVSHEEEAHIPSPSVEDDQSFTKTTLGDKGEEGREGEEESKVLGVRWRRRQDTLVFGLEAITQQLKAVKTPPTKREVVGIAATTFDPLGALSPVTVKWKMLFQAICRTGKNWDDPLDGEPLKEWNRLRADMGKGVELSIPRYQHLEGSRERRLIGFCDASEKAYGAVVYMRVSHGEGEAMVNFVAAKTRVSPTKVQTIPRLELLSALLLARLCRTIEEALRDVIGLEETLCFTDSQVSLCWIRGRDKEWKQFVENRVVTIRQLIPAQQWKHCPGNQNPADIPSRGMTPKELETERSWLHGPEWLNQSLEPTSEESEDIPEECLLEKRKTSLIMATMSRQSQNLSQVIDVEKFSSSRSLIRVIAMVLKFGYLSRKRRKNPMELLQEARILLLKENQAELPADRNFATWQKQLDLSLDEKNLWRCDGRLRNSALGSESRRPVLLKRDHYITKLLVMEAHVRVIHNGVKETLTELRSCYWVIRGRQLVRQIISRCPVCRRFEGRPFRSLPPPQLPAFRVQPERPFSSTGIDFAGPLYVREQEEPKTWLCLFTCCATRAVHLDLVPDLSTTTFIRCFRRFCSRRGIPSRMVSDNAQTFKAANQSLQTLLKSPEIQNHFEGMQIQWHFNTEKAPWQGGFFERMVKSAKQCLKKSIGRRSLSFDELLTLVTEVEAVLNSRPLSYISEDDQEEALTPSHLVTGHRVLSLPDPAITDEKEEEFTPTQDRLTARMKHLRELHARFWRRWKMEYLQELRDQHRYSTAKSGVSHPVFEGEGVIVYDESQPRGLWRLGRVKELITSGDGQVRSAKIKVLSKTGRPTTLTRPIQLLYPLEVREKVTSEAPEKENGTQTSQGETEGPTGRALGKSSSSAIKRTKTDQDQDHQELQPRARTPRAAAKKARVRFQSLAEQNLI